MRLVIDTNVLVSAFLWNGTPSRLIDLASDTEIQLFTSGALLDELAEVLHRKKLAKQVQATGFTATQLVNQYRRLAYRVTARELPRQISRDPDDDHVIACALAAPAELIVSGDRDLLNLSKHQGIRMVTAADAVRIVTGA
jgi:putative PIN family toxin of toxin-antitoxin system